MKIKFNIKQEVQLPAEVLEEKISKYLKKNFYRIVERGPGFVIFIDDEYSDRKRRRSDYHTRIGEGKFEYYSTGNATFAKLIYLTDISYPIILMTLFSATGFYYAHTFVPALLSLAFTLPIGFKIYYLNEHVFSEILEC